MRHFAPNCFTQYIILASTDLAITIVALGFSLFGDALRDTLDPRLRGSR